jgi:hypothetical protein
MGVSVGANYGRGNPDPSNWYQAICVTNWGENRCWTVGRIYTVHSLDKRSLKIILGFSIVKPLFITSYNSFEIGVRFLDRVGIVHANSSLKFETRRLRY